MTPRENFRILVNGGTPRWVPFTLDVGASAGFTWPVKVPLGMGPLAYTVVAKSESFSDGAAMKGWSAPVVSYVLQV